MKKPILNSKNLASGAFLLACLNGSLSLFMAFSKAEKLIRYENDLLANPDGIVRIDEFTPGPLADKSHLFWLGMAGLNFSFAGAIWRGKRLSIYKDGDEIYNLPAEPARLLLNRGYVAKPEPLLDAQEFSENLLDSCQKIGQLLFLDIAGIGEHGLILAKSGIDTSTKFIADTAIPPQIQSYFEAQIARYDQGWEKFKENALHAKITGGTGAGKTVLAWDYIASWAIKNKGKGQILIADTHYGKPDSDGKFNEWMGIDSDRVFDSIPRIIDLFLFLKDELQRRMNLCKALREQAKATNPNADRIDISKLAPMLIVLEEYSSLVSEIKDISIPHPEDEKREIKLLDNIFYPLIKQCRAYQMRFLVIDQTNAKNQSDMPMSIASQFSKLILANGDMDDSELKYLGVVGDYKNQLISQIEELNKSGRKRNAIAQIGEGKAKVISIPDLSGFNYRFPPKEDQEKWLDQHKASILELIQAGKSKTAICQTLKENGENKLNRQGLDNPFYRALSEFYDANKISINLTKSEV